MARALSVILCMQIILTGCASKSYTTEKTIVTVWHTWNVEEGGGEHELQVLVDEFNASQNKIDVVLESQPRDGFSTKVYNAVSNGVGPDIYFDFATSLPEYIDNGLVANMDEYINMDSFNNRIKSAIRDEVYSASDDHLHIIPIQSTAPVIFYNKTLYDELNLSAPQTWKDIIDNSEAIYKSNNVAGFATDSYIDLAQILIYETGSDYINTDIKKVGFNNDLFKQQVEWVASSSQAHYFASSFSTGSIEGDFNAGLIAAFLGTCSYEPYLEPQGFEYGVVCVPSLDNVTWSPIWNRGAIVMASNPEKEKAACEFVEFFTNSTNNSRWCMSIGALSPYKDTDEIDAFQEYISKDAILLEAKKSMENGGTTPAVTGALSVRNELKQLFLQVIGDVENLDDAMKTAEKNCNDALSE